MLEQKNINESMESYTSTISHEFRTPLGTVLMFLETILQQQLPENVANVLKLIASQLNLLLCLVNDVLDIKLIQQQKFEPKLSNFNPLSVLIFIVQMFSNQTAM